MKNTLLFCALLFSFGCHNDDSKPTDLIIGKWINYRLEVINTEESWNAFDYGNDETNSIVFHNDSRWESIQNNEVVTSDGLWEYQSSNIYWLDSNDECYPDCEPNINIVTLLCDDILTITIGDLESAESINYYRRARKDKCPDVPYKVFD